MRRAMFLLNPASGRGLIKDVFFDIVAKLAEADILVTPYITQESGDIQAYIKEASAFDMVIVSGGDGTVNQVINAMMAEGLNLPLGYLPSGTTNDLAISLGISLDPLKATEQFLTSKPKPLDIGCFNGSYFTYVAACGIFTAVSYSTSQDMKNTFGSWAYYVEGIRALGQIGQSFSFEMTLSGDGTHSGRKVAGEAIFAAVTNSHSLGGLVHLDGGGVAVEMADGLLEVLIVRPPKSATDLTKIVHSLRTSQTETPLVETYQAPAFSFRFPSPQDWTLDGEFGGNHQDLKVEVVPHAVTMYFP